MGDIAQMAGVKTGVVCNWHRRHDDFPSAWAIVAGAALFDRNEVEEYLANRKAQQEQRAVQRAEALRARAAEMIEKADALAS